MSIVDKRLDGSRWHLGTEVGLGPGHILLDGNPAASLPKKGAQPSPNFQPILLWPNGWMHQYATWYGSRPQTRRYFVLDGDRPQFSDHVYCGQTAAWIKMPLATEIGLGLRDIVFDKDPAPPPLKGHSPQFLANIRCGQTAGWTKIPISVAAIWLHGSRCHLVWRQASAQATLCSMGTTQRPQNKGHTHPTQFLAHVYCVQTAGWMKTPFGTEVDLAPGHIVLDGVPGPSSPRKGHNSLPSFRSTSNCGHGRPSQLLLSSF